TSGETPRFETLHFETPAKGFPMCGCSTHTSQASDAAASAGAILFSVPDMTCGHCGGAITAAFAEKLPGVPVEIDLAGKT
ncbi:heavy-metal-associated domain-containing protein, partial [Pseudomonas sp. MH9.3]